MSDQPADRHAGEVVEQRKYRVEHCPADILEIDINSVGAYRLQALSQIRLMMVKAGIKAEFFFDIAALPLASSDADDTAALELCDLPDNRAHGPGCCRHD